MEEKSEEFGLLGAQIALVLHAFRSPEASHRCHVRNEEVAAKDLLPGDTSRRFLTYDSLPGILAVKAIGIDARTLFVELAPYDPMLVKEAELPKGVRVDIAKHSIWHGRIKIASVAYAPDDVAKEHGARWLWMISWSGLTEEEIRIAIRTLDILDIENAYEEPSETADAVNGPMDAPRMELRLGFQLQLIQEQVPILAMRMEQSQQLGMRQQQILTLEQMQRFERWLQRNPEEAIEQALARDSSPEGQFRLVKFILFKVARDVKHAADQVGRPVEWREARRIAKKLLYQSAN